MATMKYLRVKFAIVLVLVASVQAMTSCGNREFRLTQEQVEERITKELPKGTTQGRVNGFISSFKSEFKIDEREYETRIPVAPEADTSGTPESSYHGLIQARIKEVGRDPKNFALFDLHLDFYFDEKGHLIGHKVKTYGYH